MALWVVDRFGHFDVTAFMYTGKMEQVSRAIDTHFHHNASLKIFPDTCVADLDHLAQSQRKAQSLTPLKHSNICRSFGDLYDAADYTMQMRQAWFCVAITPKEATCPDGLSHS